MKDARLLLCCDMDRTVIPNGQAPEYPLARHWLRRFCRLDNVCLVYVTGRHRALVEAAIEAYQLPTPDYVIGDVGSTIYRVQDGQWLHLEAWEEQIAPDWNGHSREVLEQVLSPLGTLELQEIEKQNRYKLSYYLPLSAEHDLLFERMRSQLAELGVRANLIWSIDEAARVGLVDVLPLSANKLHGLRFLVGLLNYGLDEVLFAGDSGNDLDVLESDIPAVLVGNAGAEMRAQALSRARMAGFPERLYLARAGSEGLGNYASGVLQGVAHFFPRFALIIEELTCCR